MFDGDCCDKVMQGGKEDINKSVFKIMSGCLMKKEKKCGNQFIFCIYTIFLPHFYLLKRRGNWVELGSLPGLFKNVDKC